MINEKTIDHLFRPQYGKMVSILTRIFGLSNIETIEDAVQDTFANAVLSWRKKMPDNPEAWLTQAAKNRMIDLFRKVKADNSRIQNINNGSSVIAIQDLFLEHEIEDSQLRMIFTACHPHLNSEEQIAFALKTIAGFGTKEIAAALLLKEDTVKKRLQRARKSIKTHNISFTIPNETELPKRLSRVLEVIYLIFNEGFHSNNKDLLIRKDLCGEAIRLCKILLKKEQLRTGSSYSLFALICLHACRLESRVNDKNEIVDLQNQDRTKWYLPLAQLGIVALNKSVEKSEYSTYHFEAAIIAEHLKAPSFEKTDWQKILYWYKKLYTTHPTPITQINIAIVLIQLGEYKKALNQLKEIDLKKLEQRAYIYYATLAELYTKTKKIDLAHSSIDKAIEMVNNEAEKKYFTKKKANINL